MQVYDDVKSFLVDAGQIAADGATQGFEIMVMKHFWVDGVVTLILSIIGMIAWIFFFIKWIKILKESREDVFISAAMFGGMILVMSLIGLISALYSGAANVFIPEYYAIMDIIEVVK